MVEALLIAARQTLIAPRDMAQRIIRLQLPLGVASLALAATAVFGAVLAGLTFLAMGPSEAEIQIFPLLDQPFALAMVQLAVQFCTAVLIWFVGRLAGGKGALPDAVALLAWLEFLLTLLQLAQLLLALALPGTDAVLGLLGIAGLMWLLTIFVTELHGFRQPWAVFFGILGTALLFSFLFMLVLTAMIGPLEMPNV